MLPKKGSKPGTRIRVSTVHFEGKERRSGESRRTGRDRRRQHGRKGVPRDLKGFRPLHERDLKSNTLQQTCNALKLAQTERKTYPQLSFTLESGVKGTAVIRNGRIFIKTKRRTGSSDRRNSKGKKTEEID